jgi:hypothetical protein
MIHVFFQIFTGEIPFHDVLNNFAVMFKVTRGERPNRPSGVADRGLNDLMWGLMQDCWEHNPTRRPTALQIVERLPHVPDNRPSVLWPRFRASNVHDGHDLAVAKVLRVLETTGISLFHS